MVVVVGQGGEGGLLLLLLSRCHASNYSGSPPCWLELAYLAQIGVGGAQCDLSKGASAVVAGHVVEEKGVLVIYGRGCCPGGGGCGKRAGGGTFVCGEEAGTRKMR